ETGGSEKTVNKKIQEDEGEDRPPGNRAALDNGRSSGIRKGSGSFKHKKREWMAPDGSQPQLHSTNTLTSPFPQIFSPDDSQAESYFPKWMMPDGMVAEKESVGYVPPSSSLPMDTSGRQSGEY